MSMTDLTTAFTLPYPELTKIEGKPTFLTVSVLKKELLANAISVPSNRGNGALGHAVIVLGQADYDARAGAGNAWVDPPNPGPEPNIPAAATGPQIAHANEAWKRELQEFKTFDMVGKKLKQQILAAVDKSFISSLDDDIFGFTNVTVVQLLTHLSDNYARIDQDALTANLEELKLPWEPAETLEPLWDRGTRAQRVAQAGNEPITDTALVRIFRDLLQGSGLFPLDIRDWDRQPVANRTLANFKTTFNEANITRIKNMTAGQLGQANYLGTATGYKPSGSAFSAVDAKVKTTAAKDTDKYTVLMLDQELKWTPYYYCWSHGLSVNPTHTGPTCSRKEPGHKNEATPTNMMGGCNLIKRQPGERAIWQPRPRSPRGSSRPGTPQANATPPASGTGTPPPTTPNTPSPARRGNNDSPADGASTGGNSTPGNQ